MNSVSNHEPRLKLHGVDHTARPTWRLRETVTFYRDILGLPLVHVISARGWGPETHPDFLHFFFDSGQGSTIAFFYYLGSKEPAALQGRNLKRPVPEDHVFDATHTAWLVQSQDELRLWKKKLEDAGLDVSVETRHEVIESVYVRDPNGYFIEFTRKLRPLGRVDSIDADLTIQAAMQEEDTARSAGALVQSIDDIWARKAVLLEEHLALGSPDSAPGVRIFVPRVAEFSSLIEEASARGDCKVVDTEFFQCVESDTTLEFQRRKLRLKPAVWYGLFTGGVKGTIEVLDRDKVRIAPVVR
ncbi:VOC family protein [Allopusillimonas soli]|uniref:VOC family protein n=1 Tax=Allopusillimonas soli TaxID=659016 RepID=A0A853FI95_9BURK|nr:VOC family protein [Allopusillimonas soli]NYT38151.1 VOC family protein [Allopusillimonas soli]TEA74025.1 VOC family protein [Allopusillimonas soli]